MATTRECAEPHLGGRRVDVLSIRDPAASRTALVAALSQGPGLVIDGCSASGWAARWIRRGSSSLRRSRRGPRVRVLSVDVPSGIDADTEALGAAVEAAVTLTLGAPKVGLLRAGAWAAVRRLELESDVGLVPCPCESDLRWTPGSDFAGYPPARLAAAPRGASDILRSWQAASGVTAPRAGGARGLAGRSGLDLALHSPARVRAGGEPVHPGRHGPPVALRCPLAQWGERLFVRAGFGGSDVPGDLRHTVLELWQDADDPVIVDAQRAGLAPGEVRSHPGGARR